MSEAQPVVSGYELAVLVLHYLDSQGCNRTSAVFKKWAICKLCACQFETAAAGSPAQRHHRCREAKKVLQGAATAPLPPRVKPLQEVLGEYVQLKAAEVRRAALRRTNPVAASLSSLLDWHAGMAAPQTLPPAFYAPVYLDGAAGGAAPQAPPPLPSPLLAPPYLAALQHPQRYEQQMQHLHLTVAVAPPQEMVPVGALGSPAGARGAAAAPQHTPGRHAMRKAAPRKRRKLSDDFAAAGGASGNGGGGGGLSPSMLPGADLLNQQMHEEGLAMLLADPGMQTRWAENLANHITQAYYRPNADSPAPGAAQPALLSAGGALVLSVWHGWRVGIDGGRSVATVLQCLARTIRCRI
jgi:hypothetical protein